MKTSAMPAVSDADVLIHLAKLDRLDLLGRLYGPVLVPGYVKREALPGKFPDEAAIAGAFAKGVLVAVEADSAAARRVAEAHSIDPGEGHVKAMAESRRAALVLTNESRVRQAARAEGFAVAGTLGVLLRAVKEGHLPKAEAAVLLERIAAEERMFRIHPALVRKAAEALKGL